MPSSGSKRPAVGEREVRQIAELARLRVTEEEIPAIVEHFAKMLDFVETLNEVDVEGIEPDLHPERSAESLREDRLRSHQEPGGPIDRQRVLENSPRAHDAFFVTPRVV